MHLMTLEAVNMLKKPSVKFDILFQALGAMRYIQACATNNLTREPLNDFGCKRLSGLYTKHEPKDQRYGPFGLYLHEQNKATQIDLSKPYHIWAQAKDGTTAIGTKITAQTWHHCSPETIPVVRKMFEEWTTYILQNNYQESPERLMADLAHWYHTSVQGTFYFRGSSAITQAMFVALCRVKGIEAPKFLDLLDCWALSMQVKDFKEQIFLPWFRKESIPLAQRYQKILWDPIGKKPNDNLSSILASPLTDSIFHQVEGLLRQGANQNQKINNWRSDNQDMSLIQFATHAVIPELANLLAQYGAEGIEKASIRSSHPVYADLNFAEVALCERKFELAKSLIAKGFTPRLEFKFPTGTTDQEETLNNVLKRKLFPEELKKLELILK
jgi:hypothetical protein